MLLSLVTAPAEEPVSLAEVKAHLRIEHTDEDSYLPTLIGAATYEIDGREGYLRRALVTQSWKYFLPYFPACRVIQIPLPPLRSVTNIKYLDATGTEQTFAADNYSVVTETAIGYVWLKLGKSWPGTIEDPRAVTIQFEAGYGAAAAIPDNIRNALLLRVGELYAGRGDEYSDPRAGMTPPVRRLLDPSRVVTLG